MIAVVPYRYEKDEYDSRGNTIARKGDMVVSHGINVLNGKIVILPEENWGRFVQEHCKWAKGVGWVLK